MFAGARNIEPSLGVTMSTVGPAWGAAVQAIGPVGGHNLSQTGAGADEEG